jgi:U-box domain
MSAITALVPPPALPAADRSMVQLYTRCNYFGKVKASNAFFRDCPDEKFVCNVECVIEVAGNSLVKTLAGAAAGGLVGAVAGIVLAPPSGGVSIVPSIVTGAKIGAGAGWAVSVMEIPKIVQHTIHQSDAFITWKTRALNDRVYPIFQEYIRRADMQDLICPISLEIPLIPVKAPCGHTYDKASIQNWLLQKPEGDYNCCHARNRIKFTAADLVYDEVHVQKIMHRVYKIMYDDAQAVMENYRRGIEEQQRNAATATEKIPECCRGSVAVASASAPPLPSAVRDGFKALDINFRHNSYQVLKSEQDKLIQQAFMSGASADEAAEAFKELYRRHAADPIVILKDDEKPKGDL